MTLRNWLSRHRSTPMTPRHHTLARASLRRGLRVAAQEGQAVPFLMALSKAISGCLVVG
jgi:hypothetical protein